MQANGKDESATVERQDPLVVEVGDDVEDVQRQPAGGEHDGDGDQQTVGLALAQRILPALAIQVGGRRWVGAGGQARPVDDHPQRRRRLGGQRCGTRRNRTRRRCRWLARRHARPQLVTDLRVRNGHDDDWGQILEECTSTWTTSAGSREHPGR